MNGVRLASRALRSAGFWVKRDRSVTTTVLKLPAGAVGAVPETGVMALQAPVSRVTFKLKGAVRLKRPLRPRTRTKKSPLLSQVLATSPSLAVPSRADTPSKLRTWALENAS